MSIASFRGKDHIDQSGPSGLAEIESECFAAIGLHGADAVPTLISYGAGRHSGHAYRRGADGRLLDVTREIGLRGSRHSLAVAAGDYDNDGDLDLYLPIGSGILPQVLAEPERLRFRLIAEGFAQHVRFRAPEKWTADFRILGSQDAVVFLGKDRVPTPLPAVIETASPRLVGDPKLDPKVDPGVFLHRAEGGEMVLTFVGDGRFRAAAGGDARRFGAF